MSAHGFPAWRDLESEIDAMIVAASGDGADVGALRSSASAMVRSAMQSSRVIAGVTYHRTVAEAMLGSSGPIALECLADGRWWQVITGGIGGAPAPVVRSWSGRGGHWMTDMAGLRADVLRATCREIDHPDKDRGARCSLDPEADEMIPIPMWMGVES